LAFRDQSVVMYEGSILVTYLDKAHRYYKQDRVDFGRAETDPQAWGKKTPFKGTTTILGDTLEKKGLMTWPLGLALRELFGFYDFEPEEGKRLVGFSKGKGTIWEADLTNRLSLVPLVQSASKAWERRQKQGADIGSLVHDAIEQYVLGTPFELTLERYEEGQDFGMFKDAEGRNEWLKTAPEELEMAKLAFERFKEWWAETKPTLINAEQIVYSRELGIGGAYDAILEIDGRRVLVDWKTSNASVSAGAPQGVYYSYFIQSAAYAAALMEMGEPKIDDLMVVSARKDGGFNAIFASDVGLTMEDAIKWWRAVVFAYNMMDKTKRELVALAGAAV
jgi:hypothetical protein